jgi:hypothetical protein
VRCNCGRGITNTELPSSQNINCHTCTCSRLLGLALFSGFCGADIEPKSEVVKPGNGVAEPGNGVAEPGNEPRN